MKNIVMIYWIVFQIDNIYSISSEILLNKFFPVTYTIPYLTIWE